MLTALTLVLTTLFHRFTFPLRNTLCSSAVAVSLHSVVRTRHFAMPNTVPYCNTDVLLLLNAGLICHLHVFRIFYSVPVSHVEASGTHSLSLKGTGVPAALTSEASQVATARI